MNALDVSVVRVAARQRSLIHRDQARALGMTLRQYQIRTRSGLYVGMQPNVARLAGSPVAWEQRLLAACMSAGAGAAASHRAAALLWGLRGIEQSPVEITVPVGRNPTLYDVVVHRATATEGETTVRRGIAVTRPAATLVALGALVDAAVLESAVEDAILRRLTTVERLSAMVEQVGGPGRTGRAALRRVLEGRGEGAAATESVLEDMMVRLLRQAGWPPPERQHRVGGVRLDFAYPDQRLGIEVHGVAFHSGAADVQRNCARFNRLSALGWRVLQFTWADVRDRGDDVVGDLSSAMAA